MFRSHIESPRLLETAKIPGLRYSYWEKGGAEIRKFSENVKIVTKFLRQ